MNASAVSSIQTVRKHWLNAATTLLACQWQLFEAQYLAGLRILETTLGGAGRRPDVGPAIRGEEAEPPAAQQPPDVGAATAGGVQALEQRALERVSLGLAPPREIYQVPYRRQIDWTRFPMWARPSDPELFEGTCHEG